MAANTPEDNIACDIIDSPGVARDTAMAANTTEGHRVCDMIDSAFVARDTAMAANTPEDHRVRDIIHGLARKFPGVANITLVNVHAIDCESIGDARCTNCEVSFWKRYGILDEETYAHL